MPNGNKLVFWIPRIISILFILFLAMFSLDVFDGNYGFWGTILALFMHNIPTLVFAMIVYFAWKYEIFGAILFGIMGASSIVQLIVTMIINSANPEPMPLSVLLIWFASTTLAISAGVLFYLSWRQKKWLRRTWHT
jgi:hypothetical protein